jgi:proteasome accessory factor C
LSRRFDVSQRELIEDLNLVFLCGLPGYGPGDLIDVEISDERVTVSMADYFGAPLRLTPAEALTLLAGGEAIAALPGMENADALMRGLQKVRKALGAADDLGGVSVRFEESPGSHLEVLQDAVEEHRRVELEYQSTTRAELTERRVDPWGLVAANGRWYLVGLDHLSSEERMFRIDRMKRVSMLEERAEIPTDFDPERYRGAFSGAGTTTMTVEISPEAARWFEDYYPVRSSVALEDGWRRVELITSGTTWGATLLLRLGDQARNPAPEELAAHARTLAAGVAEAHRG